MLDSKAAARQGSGDVRGSKIYLRKLLQVRQLWVRPIGWLIVDFPSCGILPARAFYITFILLRVNAQIVIEIVLLV